MSRLIFALSLVVALTSSALAQGLPTQFPILNEDGSRIANHAIAAGSIAAAEKLPGAVVAANPKGDVTLVEFYDLNCPYCRRASADVEALLQADKKLRLVLVPFPVLGIPSILAGRVEIAVSRMLPPNEFYRYHRALYAGRGVIDGQRALSAASGFNLDLQKVLEAANEDGITDIMKAHVRFADTLTLKATPSYLIGDVAIQGHPGRKSLKGVIDQVRQCGKAVC
ncbi:thioredoxin domain-containing protein [Pseudorhodoplanes sp.]|uniref:thioredoxin domain-containing protein n=1 Tax=Pseudorhodoplanes sp. TaxID=1934341 RepID=UPI002BE464CC|nr:thioredoxin domain-containing protein [Pseudorhodoplanes sp.]HWV51953.1 thioredoxin domain-containing protein [Pseudorhodoplanes sp.]